MLSAFFACAACGPRAVRPGPNVSATGTATRAAEAEQGLDILRYETTISLDAERRAVDGRTGITFRYPRAGVRELRFPQNQLIVEGVRHEGVATAFRVEQGSIVILIPEANSSGEERVDIAYRSAADGGLVFGERLVFSDFSTCRWMVCSEEPGDKASLSLEVIAPAGYRVLASGRLVAEHADEAGRIHSRWEEERPYSPYLYGFAAGDLTEVYLEGVPVRLRLAGIAGLESSESLRRKFQDTGRMLAFLQHRAGMPLPHDTYTQILVPGAEAQEKSSFAIIGARFLDPILTDPTEDWVIVHELAHQWWGNLVTCKDWSQFWLNEGVATFLVAAYKEERWGRAAYERELGLWREHWNVAVEAKFDVPLAYAGQYPSLRVRRAIQYSKGALFLHELRLHIGERAFWEGLKRFTQQHAGAVVESADFQSAMQEASGRELGGLFGKWVYP